MTKLGNVDRVYDGNTALRNKLNNMAHTLNFLMRDRRKKEVVYRSDGGSKIHFAYCKAAASTGSTIDCYLDVDSEESETIEVNCTLIEATNLNACFPTLSDGTPIPVVNTTNGWWCLWWFQGNEDC